MKLRSREINIFNISALDLFASAMGAFMLLSVMSLPFFPNTGDSPELVAEIADQLAQTRGELDAVEDELARTQGELGDAETRIDDLQNENGGLMDELARISVPDLDIVIALDVTASMANQIDQLKNQIVDLAAVLNQLAPSVGIGVVAYGDRYYNQPITALDITETTNMPTIERFVNSLVAEMGIGTGYNEDTPEALGSALDRAMAMRWRQQSERRYIIVVTDATAYPEEMQATYEDARRFHSSTAPEQFVSTVMVSVDEAETYLRQLAENGGGEFIDSTSGQSMLASILMAVVNVQI